MTYASTRIEGFVAMVVLDHPAGNRINFQMRAELLTAFQEVADSNARVLIVRGEGVDFCLGGDVREWPGIPVAILRPKVEVYLKALDLLERLEIPTIAMVQGGCMGGGFELALSCDMIIASRTARFLFPEAGLGIMTLQGGAMQLAERVGRTKALELVLLSEPIAAQWLADRNVINRLVDEASLKEETEALAAALAARSPRVNGATKAFLRLWAENGRRPAMDALYDISMPLFDMEDVQRIMREATDAINAGKGFPSTTFTGR